jgi:2-keto-4-pentenoate hydratase
MSDSTSLLARAILGAHRGVPVDALPADVRIASEAEAYRVQDLVNAALGGVGGWKVARAPDGVFRCSAIPLHRMFQDDDAAPPRVPSTARIEFEVGVRFRETVDAGRLPRQPADLTRLIDAVFPAIEIVSSRFSPKLQGTRHLQLADHQNCLMVVAEPKAGDLDLSGDLRLAVSVGGQQRVVVVDPEQRAKIQQSLLWLCEHALARGRPVLGGDIVITGALLGAEPLRFDEDYAISLNDRHAMTRHFISD